MIALIGQAADPDAAGEESSYCKGMALLREEGRTAEAFALLKSAAIGGHARARGVYGFLLAEGRGCPKDEAEGVRWLEQAAGAGVASAQFNLGLMKLKGRGTPKDMTAGLECLRQAGTQGYLPAVRRLAEMHYFGEDPMARDFSLALPWISKAAEAGDPWALNVLGTMHEFGQGMNVDRARAGHYYEQAALGGNVRAQNNFGNWLSSGPPETQNLPAAYAWFSLAAPELFVAGQRLAALDVALNESQKAEARKLAAQFQEEIRKRQP